MAIQTAVFYFIGLCKTTRNCVSYRKKGSLSQTRKHSVLRITSTVKVWFGTTDRATTTTV